MNGKATLAVAFSLMEAVTDANPSGAPRTRVHKVVWNDFGQLQAGPAARSAEG